MNTLVAPSPALVERALALIAAASIEEPAKARLLGEELERWRAVSAEHAFACDEALRQWDALGAFASELRHQNPKPKARKRRVAPARGTLAAILVGCVLTLALAWYVKQPVFEHSARTGVAQLARLALPDGSTLDVSARSAVSVAYFRDRRTVHIAEGEARFEVSADADRPFRVRTRGGVVEVVGTVFVVADRGAAVNIEVERGRVRVQPDASHAALELSGGERVLLRNGVPGAVEKLGNREPGSWRDGWLVFDNERLDEALPAINAFRSAPLVIADPRAAALRITGRFRAADPHSLVAALPRILPVSLVERPDGGTDVRMR